ncbi:MAG: T9SS type A sorting domain-containing protein [Bacteroidia bacterium]
MQKIVFLTVGLIYCIQSYSQIIYGASNYTEYHPGNLPIIISVPHGGYLVPSVIPNRTCNSAVLVSDANTIELAQQIDTAFVNATGCHPHIIYCNLHRSKLDCNRNIADGACGNSIAENSWNEFNNFIDTAQSRAQNEFGGKAFYIDLHGHGNTIQRLELGYLLYDNELALADSILNTNQYIAYSSIQNLVSTNSNAYSHAELLRGNFALGTLFGNSGYPSVPSQQIPFPGTTSNYYSGGYNTANHTSYAVGNTVNGLQIECNYANVRDNYSNRKLFSDSLVSVLKQYLNLHQNINLLNCNLSSNSTTKESNSLLISPNPAKDFLYLTFSKNSTNFEIEIINNLGQTIYKASNQNKLDINQFQKGMYIVKVTNEQKNVVIKKIIVE